MDKNTNTNAGQNSNPVDKKSNKTVMGVLSYLGLLVLIPFFVAKEDPFVKFHIKQGLVLLVLEIILWILGAMFWTLWALVQILDLAILIFVIIGIVNVVQGKEKELPWIGQFSRFFSF